MTFPITETKKDPKTNSNNRKFLLKIFISWLILCAFLLISHALGFDLDSFISDNAIFIALVIVYYLGARSTKRDIFKVIKLMFTDFDFNEFAITDLTSWIYFFGNLIFWYTNIQNMVLSTSISGFLFLFIPSLLALLGLRILLEFFISVFKIAENTSKYGTQFYSDRDKD